MFGFPRLKQTVADAPGGQQLIDRVLRDLTSFTGRGSEQEDDITMVTLERSGAAPSSAGSDETVLAEFELASAPGNEREATRRVEVAVAGLGMEPARLERLKTAVAEATMNAMEHGNEYRSESKVGIRVVHRAATVRIRITDRGEAGELPEPEVPDLEAKLSGRQKPRGWGLFLIEKMVDEARVESDAQGRTLELGMRLKGEDDGHA
jgi:anti-sigma regulatory factor (Ser/Thr protein kinase)